MFAADEKKLKVIVSKELSRQLFRKRNQYNIIYI